MAGTQLCCALDTLYMRSYYAHRLRFFMYMRSYFVQGFMTQWKRSSTTRGAFTAYYLTLIKHMAQQGVNRRCFYALCVDRHHFCVKHNNRVRHRWKQRLTRDMSLRMHSSQRTMTRVYCKLQTVAMGWSSRAISPLCLVGIE